MHYLVSNSVKDYTVEDYTDKEQHYAKALVPGSLLKHLSHYEI